MRILSNLIRSPRRLGLAIGIVIVGVGFVPAWRNLRFHRTMSDARASIEAREFPQALAQLQLAVSAFPTSAEPQFLMASVNRRYGQLDKVESHLARAEKLGWPANEIALQRVLVKTQVGRFSEAEPELRKVLGSGTNDGAALEIYEALAQGYWSAHRISDALECLNFWIQWRPQDVDPRLMRADVFLEFKDPVSAEKDYREILRFAPEHARTHELLGWVLQEQGKIDESIQHFQQSQAAGNQSASVLLGLAQANVRSGKMELAEEFLQRVDTKALNGETKAKVAKTAGDIARFRREHRSAVAILSAVLPDWPHDSSIHQSLALSYSALGDRESAKHHLELSREISERAQRFLELKRAVIHRPNDPQIQHDIASVLWKQGLREDAVVWWQSAVRCQSTHLASLQGLITYYSDTGKADLLNRHQRLAVAAIEPTFQEGWNAVDANNLDVAKQRLEALGLRDDTDHFARLLRAAIGNKEAKFAETLAALDGQPFAGPLRSAALTLCGEALLGLHKPLEAEAVLLESVRLNPREIKAHRWLSVIYYDLGVMEAARIHLTRVAELDINDYRPLRLLGLMNKDFELFDVAILDYQETLRRNQQQPSRQEVLLELAECQVRQRQFEEALETLESADSSEQRVAIQAECQLSLGHREKAMALVDQILKSSPHHLRALLLRADDHLQQGEVDSAIRILRLAVDNHPFDYAAALKLAQALPRIGATEEARRQLEKAESLKSTRLAFAKLHEEASKKPRDPSVRRELASMAEKMGRPDLKELWLRAADAMQ